MDVRKFHVPLIVACTFIGILAYNIWMPPASYFNSSSYHSWDMGKTDYQAWGFAVGLFFGGMSYLGLFGLICALVQKRK